jgi:maltose O-acetyltransferase
MFKLLVIHFVNKIFYVMSIFFSSFRQSDFLADLRHKEQLIKLTRKGVVLGEGSVVYDTVFSSSSKGDSFYIGKNCTITGSTLLAHDASPAVFIERLINKPQPWRPGARSSYRNPIVIGDNVFVGYGSIILPGVKIGNNVIVAAGSVVTKSIDDNVIVAGNPAKAINSIDRYKEKYLDLLERNPNDF